MTRRDVFHGICLAAGGFVGLFAGAYYALLATETPASCLGRIMRLREGN